MLDIQHRCDSTPGMMVPLDDATNVSEECTVRENLKTTRYISARVADLLHVEGCSNIVLTGGDDIDFCEQFSVGT